MLRNSEMELYEIPKEYLVRPYQVHDVDGARIVGRGLRVENRPVEVDGDELPRRSPGKYLDVAAQVEIVSKTSKHFYHNLVPSAQIQALSRCLSSGQPAPPYLEVDIPSTWHCCVSEKIEVCVPSL